MRPNPLLPVDLLTFTKEIFNGRLFCSVLLSHFKNLSRDYFDHNVIDSHQTLDCCSKCCVYMICSKNTDESLDGYRRMQTSHQTSVDECRQGQKSHQTSVDEFRRVQTNVNESKKFFFKCDINGFCPRQVLFNLQQISPSIQECLFYIVLWRYSTGIMLYYIILCILV